VKHGYAYTPASCRQRHRLPSAELRTRLDRLVLGIRLVPTIGTYDETTGMWHAHVGNELRVSYRIIDEPQQIVIVHIGSQLHQFLAAAQEYATSGAAR
jgi:hypothetical protein